jgi:hypothetical protein
MTQSSLKCFLKASVISGVSGPLKAPAPQAARNEPSTATSGCTAGAAAAAAAGTSAAASAILTGEEGCPRREEVRGKVKSECEGVEEVKEGL